MIATAGRAVIFGRPVGSGSADSRPIQFVVRKRKCGSKYWNGIVPEFGKGGEAYGARKKTAGLRRLTRPIYRTVG
jgi:hypothetical protein